MESRLARRGLADGNGLVALVLTSVRHSRHFGLRRGKRHPPRMDRHAIRYLAGRGVQFVSNLGRNVSTYRPFMLPLRPRLACCTLTAWPSGSRPHSFDRSNLPHQPLIKLLPRHGHRGSLARLLSGLCLDSRCPLRRDLGDESSSSSRPWFTPRARALSSPAPHTITKAIQADSVQAPLGRILTPGPRLLVLLVLRLVQQMECWVDQQMPMALLSTIWVVPRLPDPAIQLDRSLTGCSALAAAPRFPSRKPGDPKQLILQLPALAKGPQKRPHSPKCLYIFVSSSLSILQPSAGMVCA